MILLDSQRYVRYKGNNINVKVTLRNQIKNVNIPNLETMQPHFIRVSQIKEQFEVVKEKERLLRPPWMASQDHGTHSRIMCKKEVDLFSRLWKNYTPEESQFITREEKMGAIVDQSLTVHSRINHRKKENHHQNIIQKEFKRDPSNILCYTCDEMGHYFRYFPRGSFNKKSNRKIHHSHTIEGDEPNNKRFWEEKEDSSSDKEYGFYKDHTPINFNIWIRRNEVSNIQNQYTRSKNQMMKKAPFILTRT